MPSAVKRQNLRRLNRPRLPGPLFLVLSRVFFLPMGRGMVLLLFEFSYPAHYRTYRTAGEAAGGSASALTSPSSSERDFSSFIMGEGVATASSRLVVRWRSTASLNLKPCSSSSS